MDINLLYKRFIVGSERHLNYRFTVELAEKLAVHADGLVPEKLINKRRPSESKEIQDYRKEIYVPVSKNPVRKVITSLGKIRRSADWNIAYNGDLIPSILASNTMENYCEYEYPEFTSITNWVFSELLKRYLIDANGVYACIPLGMPENSNEYISPVAYFFDSKQVLAFKQNEYAVLLSSEASQYFGSDSRATSSGAVYYIITNELINKYEQTENGGYVLTFSHVHGLGYSPCGRASGLFLARRNNQSIYESRIDVMLPSLDEAAREYSDLQAEVVQHVHSERYQYATEECPVCRGNGIQKGGDGLPCACESCKGTGRFTSASPFGVHIVSLQKKLEDYQIPDVPFGYVQKDTEIVKVQDARVRNHLYDALAAVNMEFLAKVPLSESGVAKEVDRDELNNFVHGVAEDLVRIMDDIYRWICDLRYSVVVPDPVKRAGLRPAISVPEQYDLLSANHILSEIATLKTANANPLIVVAFEMDFIRKKFNAAPDTAKQLLSVYELDPLAGMPADEKMTYANEGVIRRIDYVVSANILRFVNRAFSEHAGFISKSFDEKMKILEVYGNEILTENSAAEKVRKFATEEVEDGDGDNGGTDE